MIQSNQSLRSQEFAFIYNAAHPAFALGNNLDILGSDPDGFILTKPAQNRRLNQCHRRRTNEFGHEGIVGVTVKVVGRTNLLDVTVFHQDNCVGHAHRFGLVVGDVDYGYAKITLQFLDILAHRVAQLCIEIRQRLIHQTKTLARNDSAGKRDPLALSTRKLPRLAILITEQSCDFQSTVQLFLALLFWNPPHLEAKYDVFSHRQMREQRIGLKDH